VNHFDLCVIGSGPAGQKAAIQAAKLDKRVCVVEARDNVGGCAINTGTIPSKALREAILRLGGHREATPTSRDFFDARNKAFTGLLDACRQVIDAEVRMVGGHFVTNGIEVIHGRASFTDEKTVEAAGDAGTRAVSADHFMIAVGSSPAKPESVPFDDQNIITSDELIRMPYLPHTMIVVGGGVIGTEYASMLTALGVRVTLIEGRDTLLDFVDSEIAQALMYHLRQSGTTLRFGEKVTRIEAIEPPIDARSVNDTMAQATLESGKTLRADALLYCIGRQGATEGLNLGAAGIETDKRGRIPVNDRYQTKSPHIYAAGDVIGFPALASTSMEQGRVAACHMFGRPVDSVPELLPYGIYAIPEISMVGWTEERLTAEGIPFESGIAQYRETARGQLLGDDTGMLKLLIHQDSHVIMGVHAIGTGATELIHIGQCVIAHKATVEFLVDSVFNYPTLAECYKIAALNGLNRIKGN